MEDIVIRWDAIQNFLYSHGITRDTIRTGKKQFNVSVWEHYGLEEATKNWKMAEVFNKCFPPTKENLQKSLVWWEGKEFSPITFMDTKELHPAETYKSHGFRIFKRTKSETEGFDYFGIAKCSYQSTDGSLQLLPVELKYSESTESTFGFPVLRTKLENMDNHNQYFPFMIFIMAGKFSNPSKISTLGM